MQYRSNKKNHAISILGYGCMRFTKKGNKIDIDKAEKELMLAFSQGVNYFDTAYIYGGSEAALGEIVERNGIRDQISIATKLPHYMVRSPEHAEKIFQEELSRLRTDYVDYYLMHMLNDVNSWKKLVDMGLEEWIKKKLAEGQIRNVGFSFHGSAAHFQEVLEAYPWDFCQIQYNYLDENTQAGRTGLQSAASKGIPVIIMEPLRGGRLVNNLPKAAQEALDADPKHRSAAELGLRWLWNQPEVTCVLSGMNSLEMVEENIRVASEAAVGEFTAEDEALIDTIRRAFMDSGRINCTGCGYCQPCPSGVNIPQAFQSYNAVDLEGKGKAASGYFQVTAMRSEPAVASLCIGCGKCEQHCPQHLPIREHLKEVERTFETPLFRLAHKCVRLFKMY